MRHITMHLDFVSPYAWLAFQQLPHTLAGLHCHVEYRPVLLGALLQQHHNPGPAGIPAKRVWTYQHAVWLGQHLQIPLQMPAKHPFNPLPLLRLALQTSHDGSINRYVAETIFRHVWQGGKDALASARLQALQAELQPRFIAAADATEATKPLLRNNTEAAAALGVFGVPAFTVDGQNFWGLDSLPMLRDYLDGHPWFQTEGWVNADATHSGLA